MLKNQGEHICRLIEIVCRNDRGGLSAQSTENQAPLKHQNNHMQNKVKAPPIENAKLNQQ